MSTIALALGGPISGAATGATPAPVVLNATFCAIAPFISNTVGANGLWSFPNNGSVVFVAYNTVAGTNTFEPVLYPTTAGAPSGAAVLGLTFPVGSMIYTMPSVVGSFIIGPFGPSKFNDSNGLCWINQVSPGVATTFCGAMVLPGSVT